LQFKIKKIGYKIFGAMSKELCVEISAHFGIESVENLVAIVVEIALLTDLAICCADWFVCLGVFLSVAFV